MSKHVRHIISFSLLLCLILYSAGNTAIGISCPNMSAQSGASNHKSHHKSPDESHHESNNGQTSDEHGKGCCNTTIENNVVKADFEVPREFKYYALHQLIVPMGTIEVHNIQHQFSSPISFLGKHIIPSCLNSREKCALLSTFLI